MNLITFINTKMKMTAIYQPIIIKCILENKTELSMISDEINKLLGTDKDYAKPLKVYPNKVLLSHGIAQIIPRSGNFTFLANLELGASREELIKLCNIKLAEFISK